MIVWKNFPLTWVRCKYLLLLLYLCQFLPFCPLVFIFMFLGAPISGAYTLMSIISSPYIDPFITIFPWRRKWHPTPIFLPGKSHGQRSLAGYGPCGHEELEMTEVTKQQVCFFIFLYSLWVKAYFLWYEHFDLGILIISICLKYLCPPPHTSIYVLPLS